jgi:hypothetical protein
MKKDILPDSRLRAPRGVQFHLGYNWVPIFCANCGASGGFVPEDSCNFAFYLCQPCSEKLPPVEGTYVEPDRVFWEKVKEAQIEKYGHELTPEEIAVVLNTQENTIFHQLSKEKGK